MNEIDKFSNKEIEESKKETVMTEDEKSFFDKLFGTFDRVWSKFLDKMPAEKQAELDEFMSDESNLYTPDGQLTEAYKAKIKEMEEYSKNNSIREVLEQECIDDTDRNALSGIQEYSKEYRALMKRYEEAQKKEGDEFDSTYWAKQQLKESTTQEEYNEKLQVLDEVLEDSILDELENDEELNTYLRDVLKGGKDE